MKYTIVLALTIMSLHASAQFGELLNKAKNIVENNGNSSSLSNGDIVSGLKEALSVGSQKSVDQLSITDGFFKNNAIKILMPQEARDAESTLRRLGLGSQVDDAILTMNRAAEDAAKSAAPIFMQAIKEISIQDGLTILKGNDSAATTFLRSKTITSLTAAFKPVVEESLVKVDATKYWKDVFTSYNKVPFVKKVNPDLTAYVTDKALEGLFYQVALEEAKIRKDPAARVTDILKKVFGN